MKKILLLLLFNCFPLFAQKSKNACSIISKIDKLIQKEHVSPKPIDDSLSVYIFDNLIDELDPHRNLFFKNDYDLLSQKFKLNIDNLILNQDCDFIDEIDLVYKNSLIRTKIILEQMDRDQFDFSQKDTIKMYKKIFPIYMTQENHQKIWTKKVKFDVLSEVALSSKNYDSIKENFETLALNNKKIIIQNELCKINSLLEQNPRLDQKVFDLFCTYFDPHTNYFSNDSKSSFIASLSKEKLSLGIVVSLNEKNEIIIADIETQGPAYRNGKLKKGDQIIAISNQDATLQVSCTALEEISTMIQSDTNKTITFFIKRKSEKNFQVTLEKEIIKDELNSVISYVIQDKSKIGYIKIPSFYSDFESKNSVGCAEDVAKEIVKLQKDHIKGLVIDLMDNGGGSMDEAIKLAGIFVHHGPISIVVDHVHHEMIVDDPYKGFLYKGPIVILVNGNSASASEFFAGILQDYNRAEIIGSTTLGKATMQTILPLEEEDTENFVKVTINKFYRVTGDSHQGIGVIPDVEIPTLFVSTLQKESDFPTAFKNDHLKTKINFKTYANDELIDKLKRKSEERVSKSLYFNSIKELNSKLENLTQGAVTSLPMNLETIYKEQKTITELWDTMSSFDDVSLDLKVSNSAYNEALLLVYPAEKEKSDKQIKLLKKNHYVSEAISILNDFYHLK